MIEFKNRFKIKPIGEGYKRDQNIKDLVQKYGGSVVNGPLTLNPGELWYYTNCDPEALEDSGLVEVIGLAKGEKQNLSNQSLLNKVRK